MGLDSARSHIDSAVSWTGSRWNSPRLRTALAAVPVVMVNGTAFIGQFSFLRDHVPWILPGVILVAATVESIAVYIAFHAHLAQMKNDSATRLKLGSYAVAAVIGTMNYSHYAGPRWHPTFMAVLMFMMSTLSPWLWGIHSRRASRDELMKRGLIEEHAVRLGATRWFWHALRSTRVMYWATWHGVNDPDHARRHFEPRYGTPDEPCAPRRTAKAVPVQPVRQELQPVRAEVPVQPPAPPAAPVRPVQPVTGTVGHELLPGTTLNGRPLVRGEVKLAAEPVAAGPLTEQMIRAAELYLAGLPDGGPYPGERTLAATYLGSEGRRRQARKLLEARKAAEVQYPEPGDNLVIQNGHRAPVMIATPQNQRPGGVSA